MKVKGGVMPYVDLEYGAKEILVAKGREKMIEAVTELPEFLDAPVKAGDVVGKITYKIGDEIAAQVDITAACDVDRMKVGDLVKKIFEKTMILS